MTEKEVIEGGVTREKIEQNAPGIENGALGIGQKRVSGEYVWVPERRFSADQLFRDQVFQRIVVQVDVTVVPCYCGTGKNYRPE